MLFRSDLPELWPLLASCLFFTGAAIAVFTHYWILWQVPVRLDPWSLPVLYAVSVAPLVYLIALSVCLACRLGDGERRKLAWAGALLITALCPVYILHGIPVYNRLTDVRTKDGCVLQTSPFTCAPASAANALLFFGLPTTEREMAKLAGTTDLGTSPGEVIACLRMKGVQAKKSVLTVDDLQRLRAPAILLVECSGLGPMSHAVLFERWEGGVAQIIDPLSGRAHMSVATLTTQWKGHAILLSDPR